MAHDVIPDGKVSWFIYAIQDLPCKKLIVGSTQHPVKRWSCHKSTCNQSSTSSSTGLAKHFTQGSGCPSDSGRQKDTLNFILVDHYNTTQEKLEAAKHEKGTKCRCQECGKLKELEDKIILKHGSFYGDYGLNSWDEIILKTQGNWKSN